MCIRDRNKIAEVEKSVLTVEEVMSTKISAIEISTVNIREKICDDLNCNNNRKIKKNLKIKFASDYAILNLTITPKTPVCTQYERKK